MAAAVSRRPKHVLHRAASAGAVVRVRHRVSGRRASSLQDSKPVSPAAAVAAHVSVGRRFTALVVATAVLAGCAPAEEDSSPPTRDDGAAAATTAIAPPVLVRELPGLLLDAAQVNPLVDATDMEVVDEWSRMFGFNTPGGDCAGAWSAAWQPVYEGSGWMGVRGRSVRKPGTGWDRVVYEAVVAFPLPADASDFYAKQVASWKTCNGRHVDERNLDNSNPRTDLLYTLEQANDTAGMLTMAAQDEVDPSLACEHALTVRNNVAVDIRACGPGLRTQAGPVASAIAAKVPNR